MIGLVLLAAALMPCALSDQSCGEASLRVTAPKFPKRGLVQIIVTDGKGDQWTAKADDRQIGKPTSVRLPRGSYRVNVSSAHYASVERTLTVDAARVLLTIDLQPLPLLTGTVLDRRTRNPVIGALAATETGLAAVTDAGGRFTIEPDLAKWPGFIVISAGSYASTTLPVPRARASKSFDRVYLGRGASIRVEVTRKETGQPINIDLAKLAPGEMVARPVIKSYVIAQDEETGSVLFSALEPGDYAVIARGAASSERLGQTITVADGEARSVSMKVVPFRLRIGVRFKGDPVAAHLLFHSDEGRWDAELATSASGETDIPLWQGGASSMTVRVQNRTTAPWKERRTLSFDDTEWLLDVPDRQIVGTVLDARTGEPIPRAKLSLSVRGTDGSGFSSSTTCDDQGRFVFTPATYGRHTLTGVAPRHLPQETTYYFGEPEQQHEVLFRLEPASSARVRVMNSRGAPIGGATLVVYHTLSLLVYGTTDGDGVGEIPAPQDDSYDVYVVPRDGSFGFVRVSPGDQSVEARIVDGACRLVFRSESESHQPIPGVWVLIRYNGRVIPDAVLREIVKVQGGRMSTDQDGQLVYERMPAGVYEFWLVGSLAEMRALSGGPITNAPTRIVATPGENVAVMSFARATP